LEMTTSNTGFHLRKFLNKLKCFLGKHNLNIATCPVTGSKLSACKNCDLGHKKAHSGMAFS